MIELTFTKAETKRKPPVTGYDAYIDIDISGATQFPQQFGLTSPKTGRTIVMDLLHDESGEYFMENEGWDGEMDARLFGGETPEGKRVLVRLYSLPNY